MKHRMYLYVHRTLMIILGSYERRKKKSWGTNGHVFFFLLS